MSSSAYAEVVVSLPVPGTFHYVVPSGMRLAIGHRVLVPFGSRRVTGFVVGADVEPPDDVDPAKLKQILERLDVEPLVPKTLLELATFTADYYLATPGEVLKTALPPGLTAASSAKLVATPEGRRFLDEQQVRLSTGPRITARELALLKKAAKGRGVKVSAAPTKAAEHLVAAGLVARKDTVGAKESGGDVTVLERALDPKAAWEHLARARTRLELYERLEDGPVDVEALKSWLGASSYRRAAKVLLERGVVREVVVSREAYEGAMEARQPIQRETPPPLTEEQRAVLEPIVGALESERPDAFLLFGVTGSGKTEVYMRAIQRARELGRGAIVLVPEIALTPQLEARFVRRFGNEVVVLHSAIRDAERRHRWRRLRDGKASIALGARSALWAPVKDLGVVVVDEEHDASFKQSSEVRYHGRDLALFLARKTNSVAILGTATPSMETLALVDRGRVEQLTLQRRVGDRPMPTIQVVDLSEEKRAMKGAVHLMSRALQDGLREVVEKKQQAILFLNRRGFNTVVFCGSCGDARRCSHCDVSLTHHRWQRKLACHYCGHLESMDRPCPKCGALDVEPHGAGTERLVDTVLADIPDARVLRLDRDVTSKVGALDKTLAAFRAHEADILVGTQMVAKGHDFPKVTLVGIVLADASLSVPDFRAAERTFQLLTQVSGRAGRADHPGRVVIQTFQPQHYALTCAIDHDARRFYELECGQREGLGYPPFSRIGLVRVDAKTASAAERAGETVAQIAQPLVQGDGRVLGPGPSPIEKIRDRFRWRVLVFAPTPARLVHVMTQIKHRAADRVKGADLVFDVDPVDLL